MRGPRRALAIGVSLAVVQTPTAGAYQTVRRWIDNGATENNTGPPPSPTGNQPCPTSVPGAPGFDPSADPTAPDYGVFRDKVAGILGSSCAFGNCHGTAANDL